MDKTKIGELAKEIEKISEIERCLGCQCFYDTLQEFKEFLEKEGGVQDINERLSRIMEKVRVTHSCLGCDPCLPAPISNELADMGGGSISCSCDPGLISFPEPLKDRKTKDAWPVEEGDYLIGDEKSPMAITTLGSEDLPEKITRKLGRQRFAIVGKTKTENIGIEKIIKNIISNAEIRFLILCGEETRGHMAGQSLLALAQNGVAADRRIQGAQGQRPIMKNLEFSAIEHFRSQIEIVNLIGRRDVLEIEGQVDACIARTHGRFEKEIAIKKAPQVKAQIPERLVLDPAGFFIVYPKKEEQRIYLEHYLNDGTLNEIVFGETPAAIFSTAIDRGLVSRLDHAAYLGRELERAYQAMVYGISYVQDRAPEKCGIERRISEENPPSSFTS